jgi:2,3-bisphosphoglycerate-independent phosphoglycerate mutase
MTNKALIIVMDGLGDRPVAEIDCLTPLEKANTPFFDKLAKKGICAMVDPLIPGVPVSTHTGMALLMGLKPNDTANLARGPVEASGIDIKIQKDDILLRCNFAHIEADQDQLKVFDRRAGRINQDNEILAQALNKIKLPHGIKASFYPTTQHRAVLHLRGKNLSTNISDTDCSRLTPAVVQQCTALVDTIAAQQTAQAVNHFSHEAYKILVSHPINKERVKQGKLPASGILCRSPGSITSIKNILNYYKVKTAVISGESTVIGLAKLFGFTSITRPEFTALANTDLKTKVKFAINAMENHDLVYLHIKGTDICAHDKQATLKTQFIEKIDSALSKVDIKDKIIAVTADHSTDSSSGYHCGDPVPSIVYSPSGRKDKCTTYSEQECMHGGWGRLNASEFLLSILDQMNCLNNFTKQDLNYIGPINTPEICNKNYIFQ